MFLPFAYTVDQYRWALFNGTIDKDEINFKWWELRERYQGVNPPVLRSEQDFDAGSKAHVATHYPYIRYFVSFVFSRLFIKLESLIAHWRNVQTFSLVFDSLNEQ